MRYSEGFKADFFAPSKEHFYGNPCRTFSCFIDLSSINCHESQDTIFKTIFWTHDRAFWKPGLYFAEHWLQFVCSIQFVRENHDISIKQRRKGNWVKLTTLSNFSDFTSYIKMFVKGVTHIFIKNELLTPFNFLEN